MSDQPAGTAPAPWKRRDAEPYEPGNFAALRHGAWSPRLVNPRARDIVEAVAPSVDWWHPADAATVWAWARTEARIEMLAEYLAERGSELDADGEPVGAATLLTQLEARAESLRGRLGLDPLSRARLGRDVAVGAVSAARAQRIANSDAADRWAELRAEIAALEAQTGVRPSITEPEEGNEP